MTEATGSASRVSLTAGGNCSVEQLGWQVHAQERLEDALGELLNDGVGLAGELHEAGKVVRRERVREQRVDERVGLGNADELVELHEDTELRRPVEEGSIITVTNRDLFVIIYMYKLADLIS